MNGRAHWSRSLTTIGGIAMLVGALDPMEGAVLILGGSGALLAGTILGEEERRWIVPRTWVFVLIVAGLGAMWGLSAAGGFGGSSERSMWWGVLVLPYLIGWSIGVWGPGAPKWSLQVGLAIGLWYLVLCGMTLKDAGGGTNAASLAVGAIGVLTLGGCIVRLIKRSPA